MAMTAPDQTVIGDEKDPDRQAEACATCTTYRHSDALGPSSPVLSLTVVRTMSGEGHRSAPPRLPRHWQPLGVAARNGSVEAAVSYVRFAALGDSVTYGLGDACSHGCRGWARILADALAQNHDLSFCNTARPGATVSDVRVGQLESAVAHRPHLTSLVVGLNDTMRSDWNPEALRDDLHHIARRLTEQGALLLTVHFHDHTRVLRLPQVLARPMRARIATLNDIYDELHAIFGGLRLDLASHSGIYNRAFWSIDRLHPSQLGHRALADAFAALLNEGGLAFASPGLQLEENIPGRLHDLRWLVAKGTPWIARRVRDLAPAIAHSCITTPRTRRLLSVTPWLSRRHRGVGRVSRTSPQGQPGFP